jgi:mRNA-degrading endonuclease YafQ of YafQ-DinJ toxin-antitoxin module
MKIQVGYAGKFVKILSKYEESLKEEVLVAVEKFKNTDNHVGLKVHKLKGRLGKYYAFSVNYSHRIIFEYLDEKTMAILLVTGDHSVYKKFDK